MSDAQIDQTHDQHAVRRQKLAELRAAVENAKASAVELSAADVAELESLVDEAEGDRYEGRWGQFEARM